MDDRIHSFPLSAAGRSARGGPRRTHSAQVPKTATPVSHLPSRGFPAFNPFGSAKRCALPAAQRGTTTAKRKGKVMRPKFQARWISKRRADFLRKGGNLGSGVLVNHCQGFLIVE